MQMNSRDRLWLAQDRIAREIDDAAWERRLDRPTPSIRRTVGHSIMRIGARLAAEPSLELARPR
jgi:hypothetical protein